MVRFPNFYLRNEAIKTANKIFIVTLIINPIVHGGGRRVNLATLSDFFNNFFFTQAKSLKFSDFTFLSFRHNVAKFH